MIKNFLSSADLVYVAPGIAIMNITLHPQKIKGISLKQEGYVPRSGIQMGSLHQNK